MASTRSSILSLSAGAVALVLAACGPDSTPSGDVSGGPARGDATRIVADDNHFDPNGLELDAGRGAEIEITNNDDTAHDFTIESLDLSTGIIEPGEVATARFRVPEEGLEFVCSLHDGMSGRIEAR
ncbi:MAG TPA: cupredoxin domain-containing protein [Actinomycetota bacterium]|jgi:plastocyanin|nr:cupredoxin domain-containing protein [Actinomycetota bacterium]